MKFKKKVGFFLNILGNIRNEAIMNLNSSLENDLPKLSEGIKNESNEREEVD